MAFTLRQETASGFTTKGSALSYAEGDNNFIGLYERDDERLALTGVTLTGSINVTGGQILSGGTDIATLWGGGGGGASVLNDLTDVECAGTGANYNFFKNGTTADGVPVHGSLSTALRNIALGAYALNSLTSGDDNIMFGYTAGYAITDGQYNLGIGYQANRKVSSGDHNIALGDRALFENLTGGYNIALGREALYSVTGTGNIAIGQQSGRNISSGNSNIVIGYNTTGTGVPTTGDNNIVLGKMVGVPDPTADGQLVIGSCHTNPHYLLTGDFATSNQCKLGINLGSTGSGNARPSVLPTATLHVKGQGTTTATTSLLVQDSAGESLMRLNDDGQGIAIGHGAAGANAANVGGNICIGKDAMNANGTGFDNVYIGVSSGFVGNAGWRNVALGNGALRGKTGNYTFYSCAIGYYAMYDSTSTGAYTGANTAIGTVAGKAITSGVNNLCLGAGAGYNLTTGSNNIFIGSATSGVDASIIPTGYVAASAAGVDNELNIGNQIIGSMDSSDQYTKFVGQTYGELYTQADGVTITPDFTNGNVQTVELGGNRAIANPTNIKVGATYMIILKQDATGSRTVTWGTNYKFPGGTAPTLTTTGDQADVITLIAYSASVLMCSSTLNFATS